MNDHAHVVAAHRVGLGEKRRQVEVADGAHEVVFAQNVVVDRRAPLGQGLDDRVGRVDDVVGAPPQVGVGIGRYQVAVADFVVERVFGFVGQRHVVAVEFGHLEEVADVGVARIDGALVLQMILEHRVVAVSAVYGRRRVVRQLTRSHGVGGVVVQLAGREQQREEQYGDYLFHRFVF